MKEKNWGNTYLKLTVCTPGVFIFTVTVTKVTQKREEGHMLAPSVTQYMMA